MKWTRDAGVWIVTESYGKPVPPAVFTTYIGLIDALCALWDESDIRCTPHQAGPVKLYVPGRFGEIGCIQWVPIHGK